MTVTRHQHASRRVARLSAVVETRGRASADRFFEVRVVKNDVWRFATEFLRDALHRRCRVTRDLDAGARGTGKRHHGDIRMPAQLGANSRAIAVDQVEHTRRYTGRVEHLGEQHRVKRRDFTGLQNHRAASRQRRRDLDGNLVDRPVPRRDQCARPDRLAHDARRAVHFLEREIAQGLERRLDVLRAAGRLFITGERPRGPHFFHDGRCNLVVPFRELIEDGRQEVHPLFATRRREGREGPRRRRDRAVDVGLAAQADVPHHGLRRRIDDLERAWFDRVDPFTVYVEFQPVAHCVQPLLQRAANHSSNSLRVLPVGAGRWRRGRIPATLNSPTFEG